MTEHGYLPEDVRLRVMMKGITVDVRADSVNNELALELIEKCLEKTENRLEDAKQKGAKE